MPTIPGIDRHQIIFTDLERQISKDNVIRFIDAFVDKMDLKQLDILWEWTPNYPVVDFLQKTNFI